ncbi:TetR/AcrR family transcriptional regulator [Kibdelosporangium phytohabitans]|uniref:TetR family transcriptional regulator n=1 Tax=Kibdelosporangium phytohabitans TaxID=860235 RepID=A0A0N9I7E1_9PSEU|nr:TetR/AcrR family transcriptional regulator [Kibdelosporangium phytohabitans]ALG10672.1 TetR family transcriptional regulator [Kibdelosporangium phytohabitans]MBE1461799.1 AcrR family transcriptional regulator [Kibdelosporangium phytohabitans]
MPSSAHPGSADGRAKRWAGQRDRRRREFVEAALRVIAERGPGVSTEQIAHAAGVARTQLYKHFTDAADVHGAIAERAMQLIHTDLAPLWNLHGTPMEMISSAVGSHTRWLSENQYLYRYLSMHALSAGNGPNRITDVKTTIGNHLTRLFEHYLALFSMDTRVAGPVAFGVVGLVDSCTAQWLADPRRIGRDEFVALLARWVWSILDDTLRAGGMELDAHAPLAAPDLKFPPSPE